MGRKRKFEINGEEGEGGSESNAGFEEVFDLVGGHGRFQWICLAICALQLMLMTWNHMGYIFMGAVPDHWCHIPHLENSSWTTEQIKNISLPKVYPSSRSTNSEGDPDSLQTWKYDQCNYHDINYQLLLEESFGNFERAYDLLMYHPHQFSSPSGNNTGSLISGGGPLPHKVCQGWDYDQSLYHTTIVTEFNLVCGKRYLVASIQALYMIGAFIGTLIFGPLNDKILGRRNAVLLSIVLVVGGGALTALSTSYIMFVACRFLVAIGTAGCMQASSVWFLEHCDTKSRARLYCISSIFFGVGYAIMPLYAYFIRSWSNLQLAFTLTTTSLFSFFWIFPESPRWLASHGRDDDAVKALQRIARFNKIKPPPERAVLLKYVRYCHPAYDDDTDDNDRECKQSFMLTDNNLSNPTRYRSTRSEQHSSSRSRGRWCLHKFSSAVRNFGVLVSTPQLRRISILMWIQFVAVAFVYYGFAFSSINLTTNPYLLVSLGAFMEVPASVLPIPFLARWGRRPTISACFLCTGLSALAIAFTPAVYETMRTLSSMAGKLFVASGFTVLYLVVNEVYPTVVRGTGQGTSTLMGRFGSIAAPYVADMLTSVYPDLPSVIFGIVALVAAPVAMAIPEMKDAQLRDQVYECKPPPQSGLSSDKNSTADDKLENKARI